MNLKGSEKQTLIVITVMGSHLKAQIGVLKKENMVLGDHLKKAPNWEM